MVKHRNFDEKLKVLLNSKLSVIFWLQNRSAEKIDFVVKNRDCGRKYKVSDRFE